MDFRSWATAEPLPIASCPLHTSVSEGAGFRSTGVSSPYFSRRRWVVCCFCPCSVKPGAGARGTWKAYSLPPQVGRMRRGGDGREEVARTCCMLHASCCLPPSTCCMLHGIPPLLPCCVLHTACHLLLGPGGGGGLQPVLMRPTPQLSFKTWGGRVQLGVGGGGGSCRI